MRIYYLKKLVEMIVLYIRKIVADIASCITETISEKEEEKRKTQEREVHMVPRTKDLFYPGELPTFAELEAAGHEDMRALVYVIRFFDTQRKWPLRAGDFQQGDFGSEKKTVRALQKKGLVREYSKEKIIETIYEKEELKRLLRSRGQLVGGRKAELAARLVASGFQIDKGRYKNKLYELTEAGKEIITERREDEEAAIQKAAIALKSWDYYGAIGAYREFDNKWGFAHTSGKKHTIFAHYDVPFERIDALARYPMRELQNTEDFKNTVRACMIAGMMRGSWRKEQIAKCVTDISNERIVCPKLMNYYGHWRFGDDESRPHILARMKENIAFDNIYTLEYYIALVFHKTNVGRFSTNNLYYQKGENE